MTVPQKIENSERLKQNINHRSPFLEEIKASLYWRTNRTYRANHTYRANSISQLGSIVDIYPTLLEFLKIKKPYPLIGKESIASWFAIGRKKGENHRNSVIFEHKDSSKTMITDSYKITIFYGDDQGEIYDIRSDSKEIHNLWNEPSFEKEKAQLFLQFLWAQLDKEVMPMPRISGA